ncbi:hypothetical protein VSU16_02980 [Cetobacterium somerae]|uniref:hypothetical protein n=1 Tax=Cetobacterium somerae TaxID=188913 RepID=UPI002E7C3971|nr:hypothetical protein [Cetobacterium somerae]WVJ01705.1 hypothetical protein VSU16_02980 [Cetobacterium somerae]
MKEEKIEENNSIFIEEPQKSIFKSFYTDADEKITKIVKIFENRNLIKKMEEYNEYTNNIISFVGERGSGKTSMMLNFSKMKKKEAYVLDLIEPELFENKINLLEIVVSRLYTNFQKKYKELGIQRNFKDEIRELNLKFLEIIKNIKTYFEKRENYDFKESSDNLFEISNALNLKDNFKTLVENYIKIMNLLTEQDFKYVIILIDDMDLNFENTYLILEQLRKFLIIPNLINMIAYKESQLIDILENQFQKTEKSEVTEKYLKKLFPYENKLYTPTKEEIIIAYNTDFSIEFKDKIFKNLDDNENDDIIHEFYPETLRETIALKKFFKTSEIDIGKYIKFLGGKYIVEINKIKKNKQYLKILLEANKKLESNELSIEEIKILSLKKEYILSLGSKKKKSIKNMLKNAPMIIFSYEWAKKNIVIKNGDQLLSDKALKCLYQEINALRGKEKKELLFLIQALIENNKINIWNLFDKYEILLSLNEIYGFVNALENTIENYHCKDIDEFFKILALNKNLQEKTEFAVSVLRKKIILKKTLELALFFPGSYYEKFNVNDSQELEYALLSILEIKRYSLFLPNLSTLKKEEDFVKHIDEFHNDIKYLFNIIIGLEEEIEIYEKKIQSVLFFIKLKFMEISIIEKSIEDTEIVKTQNKMKILEEIGNRIIDLMVEVRQLLNDDLKKIELDIPESYMTSLRDKSNGE